MHTTSRLVSHGGRVLLRGPKARVGVREQATAETPDRVSPHGPGSALSAELRVLAHAVGFEPTTSRVTDEVTAIFTTDRVRKQLAGNGRCCCCPEGQLTELRHCCRRESNHATSEPQCGWRSPDVTGIFTTAFTLADERSAGEQARLYCPCGLHMLSR